MKHQSMVGQAKLLFFLLIQEEGKISRTRWESFKSTEAALLALTTSIATNASPRISASVEAPVVALNSLRANVVAATGS